MKNYLNILGMTLFIIFSFGVLCPPLISSDDWVLFAIGIVWLFVISPISLYYWFKTAFKKSVKEKINE